VIGAGVTGALIAFMLVEAGLDVVVVDRHDVAGDGCGRRRGCST
jgi:glycine/D-amino acid oxidase-like deaminating enzyme